MQEELNFGRQIRNKRLLLNMTMDYVANKAGITRATLSMIENGSTKCSLSNLLSVLNVLNLDLNIVDPIETLNKRRHRASRTNTSLDKKINNFIVMCIEQYAASLKTSGDKVYKEMENKGVIKELKEDYEDLHGMSTMYLNNYISSLLSRMPNTNNIQKENTVVKTLIIQDVIRLIANKDKITLLEATDKFYKSETIKILEDDSSGLYGYSSLYVFSLYLKEVKYK